MWSPKKVQDEIGRLYGRKVSRRNEFDIFLKDYLNRNDEQRTAKPKSMWLGKDVNTEAGGKLVTRILGKKLFDYPKPVALVKSVLQIATDKNSIVLDNTAGSGTTGHAVLEINKEDGGQRKFILVQQPYDTKENAEETFNICQKITSERNRRVIKGYSRFVHLRPVKRQAAVWRVSGLR
jgi:adenine-specific DNA-methyltransferase